MPSETPTPDSEFGFGREGSMRALAQHRNHQRADGDSAPRELAKRSGDAGGKPGEESKSTSAQSEFGTLAEKITGGGFHGREKNLEGASMHRPSLIKTCRS